jgi:hypothetical protein
VYAVADYFGDGTVLVLGPDDREPAGTYSKKVRWIGADYAGPVLIRTTRLDGSGAGLVSFADWGTRRDGGYYADLPTPDSDLPAVTTLSGPGCYAYQIDGSTFTTTIVFQATLS